MENAADSGPKPGDVFSIPVRLQRTTVERAYVLVPLTADLTEEGRLSGSLVFARAIELSSSSLVRWYPEEQTTRQHPVQRARGADEIAFSPIDLEGATVYSGKTIQPVMPVKAPFEAMRRDPEAARTEQIRTRVVYSMPALTCTDVEASTRFYVERLGFQDIESVAGTAVQAVVARDSFLLQLQPPISVRAAIVQPLRIIIWVTDLEMLQEELRFRRTPFTTSTGNDFDGTPGIEVQDPDGHTLCFLRK